MIMDLLKTILTDTQYSKINRLFQRYPQLLEGKPILVSTKDIQKAVGIRSDHAIRDLKRLGEITGRLIVEEVVVEAKPNNFIKEVSDPFGYEQERIKKGGRHNARGMRISWITYSD